jgi:hypothetical protein
MGLFKVVSETVFRNDRLRCFIHIFMATCFGLSDDHLQANRIKYSKKLLLLQQIHCV